MTLLLSMTFFQHALAANYEKRIGTLELVERSYSPNIEDCLKNLKQYTDAEENTGHKCKAVYFQDNGTETYHGEKPFAWGPPVDIIYKTYGFKLYLRPTLKKLSINEAKDKMRDFAQKDDYFFNQKIYKYKIQKVFLN